jgi:hypothetical protein
VAPSSPSTLKVQQPGTPRPAAQRPADVDGGVEPGVDRAGEHDLLEPAGADALHGVGHRRQVARGGGVDDVEPAWRADRRAAGRCRVRALDGGDPPAAAARADEHLRDDERAGAAVEGERAERDQAAAGLAHGVLDVRGAHHGVPPLLGGTERVGAVDDQPGCLAPAHQALALAHPGQRALGRQQVEQRAGIGQRHGADGPQRHLGDRRHDPSLRITGPGRPVCGAAAAVPGSGGA